MKKTGRSAETRKTITCTSTGKKDMYGAAIWQDVEGNLYHIRYARLTKENIFIPCCSNNIEEIAAK